VFTQSLSDVQVQTIDRLTRRAVESYGQMVEVWLVEGNTARYYIARTTYQKDLRELGEALNQTVGRPRALAMREDLAVKKGK
jgi:hypothetical protein